MGSPGGSLGPVNPNREQGSEKLFMEKLTGKEPGYGRTERANKARFTRRDNKVTANMQCPASNCRVLRHIAVIDEFQDSDEVVMASNIMTHARNNTDSPYRCGTCKTPLVMYEAPVERRHDREEI